MTDDKLCAGFLNSNASACKGDSGGGLVYEFGGRYYLLGVVSVSPPAQTQEGGCNSQQYTLYTNVSYYTEKFILDKETRFRPSDFGNIECNYRFYCVIYYVPDETFDFPSQPLNETTETGGCYIPHDPHFAKWSNTSYPNGYVGPGTELIPQCDEHYKLVGPNISICLNGKWSSMIGQCLRTCPPRLTTPYIQVTCIDENTETENCIDAVDGTLAKSQCAPYYEDLRLKRRPTHVCYNGSWDQPTPSCTPVCGRSNSEHPENYSWQVDVYSATNEQLLCVGSLLSERIILTVSSCLTDGNGTYLPKESFTVAAEGSSRHNRTQYSTLQDILFPEDYHSHVSNSVGDIAILVTQKLFQLSANVQPVCIDLTQSFETPKHGDGQIIMKIRTNNDPRVVATKPLNASIFSASECIKKLESLKMAITSVITNDEFCAFVAHDGVIIAETGRGMFQKNGDKLYIIGILSSFHSFVSLENPGTRQNLLIYTTVSKHLNNFIIPQLAKYKS